MRPRCPKGVADKRYPQWYFHNVPLGRLDGMGVLCVISAPCPAVCYQTRHNTSYATRRAHWEALAHLNWPYYAITTHVPHITAAHSEAYAIITATHAAGLDDDQATGRGSRLPAWEKHLPFRTGRTRCVHLPSVWRHYVGLAEASS